MPIVHIDIPEETLLSLKQDPESFSRDLRLLAAIIECSISNATIKAKKKADLTA